MFHQQRHPGLQWTRKHLALEANEWEGYLEGSGKQNTCCFRQHEENIFFLYIASQGSLRHSGLQTMDSASHWQLDSFLLTWSWNYAGSFSYDSHSLFSAHVSHGQVSTHTLQVLLKCLSCLWGPAKQMGVDVSQLRVILALSPPLWVYTFSSWGN